MRDRLLGLVAKLADLQPLRHRLLNDSIRRGRHLAVQHLRRRLHRRGNDCQFSGLLLVRGGDFQGHDRGGSLRDLRNWRD